MKTRFYILLSMALLLLTQTSCVYDNDIPCGSEDPDLLVINLNLTVPTSSTGTRSAGDELVPGTEDENYINIEEEDYQVLMFDKDGDLVEDKLSVFKCEKSSVSDESVSYTLTAHLTLTNNQDREALSTFKVMVLANWKSFERSNTQPDYTYPSFSSYGLSGDAPHNIFKNRTDFNFTLKPDEDNFSWMPSIPNSSSEPSKAIPMFGITEEVDLQFAIDMAKYGDEPSFHVPMLRSLAKIEIVNKTPEEDDITIESCKLTAYNSKGRFIPDITMDENADWNDPYTQVGSASLPNDYDSVQLDEKDLLFVSLDGGKTFVVYIPEMDLDKIKDEKEAEAIPYVELMVTANGNEYGPYPIDLGEYNTTDGKFSGTYYHALLRNHKYTFNINKVTVGVTGELNFIIETPWQQTWNDSGQEEWDFEDVDVAFESPFQWTDGVNYEEEPNNPLIPQRTLVITQDAPIVGKFKLSKPVKGTWTLALYGDDFTLNDHFRIDIWKNGEWENGAVTITGDVGYDLTFRIIPTATNNDTNHYTARVVLTCMTFDGQIMEVNLTGSDELPTLGNNGYYFVKQYYSGFGDNGDDQYENNNQN